MVSTTHAIEVPLPPNVDPTDHERALAEVVCSAVLALRQTGVEPCWTRVAGALREKGWDVHWQLAWVAEGRRAGHIEEGRGTTLDEAFDHLRELALLHEVEGCP
jgi:hypothetical protein